MFIDEFLEKYCNLRGIIDKRQCINSLEGFATSYNGFLSSLEGFLLEQGLSPEQLSDFTMRISSGESIILIYPDFVVKIFQQNGNSKNKIMQEVKLSEIHQPYLIWILKFVTQPDLNAIVYEPVDTLTTEKITNFSKTQLIRLLTDIAKALDHLMLNNYEHGDPGHTNIGLSKSGRYVLLDLEDMKESSPDKNKDLKRFLEDLALQFKNAPDGEAKQYLQKLIDENLDRWYAPHEYKRKTFVGIIKTFVDYDVNYRPGDLLEWIHQSLGQND